MTTSPATAATAANVAGSLWMIAAMAAFAVEDSLVKATVKTLPLGQFTMLFGIGGALVFAAIARLRGEPLLHPDVLSRPMRLRVGFEVTGRLFYFLALALTPLSAATVILQATPLVVVAGAALIFGERVGPRRWAAILIGMVGVVIVIGPGADSFTPLSVLALIGMLGFAGRDLASRAAPATLGTATLGFYGFLSVIVAGAIYAVWDRSPLILPDAHSAMLLTAAIAIGTAAYSALMKAMRTGEVSAVTPFRYTRLLFGIGLGVVAFGETVTLSMLAGSGLIVLSGLFIMWRGRVVGTTRRKRRPFTSAPPGA